MNVSRTLFFSIFALLSLVSVNSINAAPMTESLGVEIVSGPATGETGTIDVFYDDLDIGGVGEETLDSSQFTLELMIFGQTFMGVNDIDFPGFPEMSFTDGTIVFIDFIIEEDSLSNPTAIDDPRIANISGGEVFNGVWLAGTSGPQGVPLPSTLALLGLGLTGIGLSRRRKAQKSLH